MFYTNFRYLIYFCTIIVVLQVAATLSSFSFTGEIRQSNWDWGIYPRSLSGLLGIFTAPFIHGSMLHVLNNLFGLLILGTLLALTSPSKMWHATAFIVVVGGLGVWLFGRDANHVGASGIVFGWIGFLLLRSVFTRNFLCIIASLLVGFYFGAELLGIFSDEDSISWESHFFSVLSGFGAAYVFPVPKTTEQISETTETSDNP